MQRRLLIVLYAASGGAALVYEVVWTRLLTLQLGHTVAAASTVLAAFMGGLALGAALAGKMLSPSRVGQVGLVGRVGQMRAYAGLELAIAVFALLLPYGLQATVPALAWAYADGAAPLRFGLVRVAVSLILVGAPAAAMGATFPIASQWLADRRMPSAAGVLYASNTVGAALGAIAAGFWLIPAVGLRATTWVGVALNVVAAGGALFLVRLKADASHQRSRAVPASAWQAAKAVTPKLDGDHERRRTGTQHSSTQHPSTQHSSTQHFSTQHFSTQHPSTQHPAPERALALLAVAISGFSALVCEVAWTRLLALVIGPTTYAFSTMAASFIGGLAVGSAVGTPLSRRTPRPLVWLAAMLMAGAVASAVAAWFAAARLPLIVGAQVADPDVVFSRVVVAQAFSVALLLLPATFALGATFPLALAVSTRSSETVAADTAAVYTANTTGAIAGAMAAGFVLIPLLGLRATFQVAAAASIVTAAVCVAAPRRAGRSGVAEATADRRSPGGGRAGPRPAAPKGQPYNRMLAAAAIAAAALATILALPPWDHEVLASGAYKYAPYLQSADLGAILRAGTLEYYREGAAATVSVRTLTGTRSLSIDGKVDASDGGDMLTQRLLGLLPVLLHGRARSLAVIGLGSGVTIGSALAPGTVQEADVIEISPDVVTASRFFDNVNDRALMQPGVRLVVGDGRSHLLLTPRQYDVIVSEPSNPWMAGVAALFTREFFEAARARLAPDGVLCQWAHTYDISADDLRSIVRTFASVFPEGTMWLVGEGDLLLIGTNGGSIETRLETLVAACRKGATPAMLATLGIDPASAPFSLLSLYAGGPRDLQRFAGEARVQTDDRMPLEYSAPRGIYGRTTADNAATLRSLTPDLPPAVRRAVGAASDAGWTSRGSMLLKADAYGLAYDAFARAATLNSRNAAALAGLSDAAGGAHREVEERQFLTTVAAREPDNAAIRVELARLLAGAGQFDAALEAARGALEQAPSDPRAAEQLASVLADAGDADRLAPLADRMVERFPGRPDPLYYRATALFMRGQTEAAVAAVRPVVDAHPEHARAQNLLGAACATIGRRDCAQAAFEASIRANPRDPSTYVNVGTFALQNANPAAAANYFAEALSIDPRSDAARNGLTQARAQLGTTSR